MIGMFNTKMFHETVYTNSLNIKKSTQKALIRTGLLLLLFCYILFLEKAHIRTKRIFIASSS